MPKVRIDLIDADRRPVVAEVDIRDDTVEIHCRDLYRGSLVAIQDRAQLRDWLADPLGTLVADDASWGSAGHGGIWLSVPDLVQSCWLTPDVVDRLRDEL